MHLLLVIKEIISTFFYKTSVVKCLSNKFFFRKFYGINSCCLFLYSTDRTKQIKNDNPCVKKEILIKHPFVYSNGSNSRP